MPIYAFYADAQHKFRADGRNTVVVSGTDAQAARGAGEALIGEPGALSTFAVVDLTTAPAFVVEGHPPVGARGQAVWPTLGRGGDPLRGA